ncbi:hypothetical protein DPMN_187754 [Dreissena polymorpha]|uniref:Uncharacterized protein n=1 Tax=Dreissena polymorpha TaxID=45954 RepID=A0A9D4DQD8_DREPO|nr:hypothetical protein DPMN_187754 [Dreissena polymorpha]
MKKQQLSLLSVAQETEEDSDEYETEEEVTAEEETDEETTKAGPVVEGEKRQSGDGEVSIEDLCYSIDML